MQTERDAKWPNYVELARCRERAPFLINHVRPIDRSSNGTLRRAPEFARPVLLALDRS
ncbi:hypothetical protein C7476_10175 [Phyllobacterium bourgognense]|uniref:Uncharacterized protein n=1 Tax=Phyllobacterium bourgognense TaxID=314236 RepID=A0A368ZA28_9HYPH|nr:hypothetical protein C7476_10175 [Phyllobacterium bourgognense]